MITSTPSPSQGRPSCSRVHFPPGSAAALFVKLHDGEENLLPRRWRGAHAHCTRVTAPRFYTRAFAAAREADMERRSVAPWMGCASAKVADLARDSFCLQTRLFRQLHALLTPQIFPPVPGLKLVAYGSGPFHAHTHLDLSIGLPFCPSAPPSPPPSSPPPSPPPSPVRLPLHHRPRAAAPPSPPSTGVLCQSLIPLACLARLMIPYSHQSAHFLLVLYPGHLFDRS